MRGQKREFTKVIFKKNQLIQKKAEKRGKKHKLLQVVQDIGKS